MSQGPVPPSEPYQPPWPPGQGQQPQPPQYGQPQYGQPQPPQYGQPQYGQPQPPQYGQPQYGQPQSPQYGQPQPYPSPKRRRPGLVFAAVAATVVVIGGGLTAGYQLLGGSGDRPERHLPATTIAIATIDLDPGLGQKVDAVRFLSKFPNSSFSESEDPRKSVWTSITKDQGEVPTWTEVEAWLGNQAVAAVVPSAADPAKPAAVVVVAVSDEAAARTSLAKVKDLGVAVGDGWAYLSENAAQSDAVLAGARAKPLSDDATFNDDLDAIGERGITTAWLDGGKVSPFLDKLPTSTFNGADPALFKTTAHGALTLRFSGASVELTGKFSDLKSPKMPSTTPGVERLPAGTLAAFGTVGLGDQITSTWNRLRSMTEEMGGSKLNDLETQTGLRFPGDLAVLLGDSTTMSVGAPASDEDVAVALRVRTKGNYRSILSKIMNGESGQDLPFVRKDLADGYILASSQQQADAVASGSGLNQSKRFTNAVPDADGATSIAYADIAGLVKAYGSKMSADNRKNLEPFDAVGLSVKAEDTHVTFRLRLTTR